MEFRERWLRERNSFPWAWTLFREFLFLAVRNVHWVSVFVWRARRTRRTRKEKKNAARDGNARYEADYLRVCVFISHFHRDRLEVLAECYEVTSAYESDRIRSRAFLRASRRRFSRGCRAFDTKEIRRNKLRNRIDERKSIVVCSNRSFVYSSCNTIEKYFSRSPIGYRSGMFWRSIW